MNEGEASQCRECSTNWERSISHFDLSSLISMARMQSAQRKKARKIEKVVTPARNHTLRVLSSYQSPKDFICLPIPGSFILILQVSAPAIDTLEEENKTFWTFTAHKFAVT